MIGKGLKSLQNELDAFLKRLPELNLGNKQVVDICPVIKSDGSAGVPNGMLGITLVNIEEERSVKSQTAYTVTSNNTVAYRNPEIKLNLYILIVANCSDSLYRTKNGNILSRCRT